MSQHNPTFLSLLIVALAATSGAAQERRDDLEIPSNRLRVLRSDNVLIDDVDESMAVQVAPPSKWMGVMCRPVDDSLRAHVNLPAETGLLLEEVIPDSPAAEAGLVKFDILTSANGGDLNSLVDLMNVIRESGDEPIELEWVRKNNSMTGTVKPAERPDGFIASSPSAQAQPMIQGLRRMVDELEGQNGVNLNEGVRLRFFGDGIGVGKAPPADLNVKISKEGNQPAKITVKKGNSTWEVTEDRLDELPEDVRPFVARMMGGGHAGHFDLNGPIHIVPGASMPPVFDEQMREMKERLEQMSDQLRELRESRDAEADEDDDTIDA